MAPAPNLGFRIRRYSQNNHKNIHFLPQLALAPTRSCGNFASHSAPFVSAPRCSQARAPWIRRFPPHHSPICTTLSGNPEGPSAPSLLWTIPLEVNSGWIPCLHSTSSPSLPVVLRSGTHSIPLVSSMGSVARHHSSFQTVCPFPLHQCRLQVS